MFVNPEKTEEIANDWRARKYYDRAEQSAWLEPFWKPDTPFRKAFQQLDLRVAVDLACGHGRHSARILETPELQSKIEHLHLLDVNTENVAFCRERFANVERVSVEANNGYEFQPLLDASATSIFCYDAMVHFEFDAVMTYVVDAYRVLQPGGRALLHHSNYDSAPGASYQDNPNWRNFMSKALFAHVAARAGFDVLSQTVFDWGKTKNLDCLSLIEKPVKSERRDSLLNAGQILNRDLRTKVKRLLRM